MFDSVARSSTRRLDRPGPKNSTKLPTTPRARSIWVSVRTRSVAVVPVGSAPFVRTPTTLGHGRKSGWPSIAASASIPPTPQPRMPRPLIMVVGEGGHVLRRDVLAPPAAQQVLQEDLDRVGKTAEVRAGLVRHAAEPMDADGPRGRLQCFRCFRNGFHLPIMRGRPCSRWPAPS